MIDGKNVFDHPVKSDMRACDNIRKIVTGQGDKYKTGCLVDHKFFNEQYKMVAIDLNKQQALDANRKAIKQINFRILDQDEGATMFFIIKEA